MFSTRSAEVQTRLDRAYGGLMAVRIAEAHCSSKDDFLKFAMNWREKTQNRLNDDIGRDKTGARPGKAARDAQRFAGGCLALRDIHENGGDNKAYQKVRQRFKTQVSNLQSKQASKHGTDLYDSKRERSPAEGAWWLSDTRRFSTREAAEMLPSLAKSAQDAKRGMGWKTMVGIGAGKMLFELSGATKITKPVFGESLWAEGLTAMVGGIAIEESVSRYFRGSAAQKYRQETVRFANRLYADRLSREADPEAVPQDASHSNELEISIAMGPDGRPGMIFNRLPTADEIHQLAYDLA